MRSRAVVLFFSGALDFICPGTDSREIAWQLIDQAVGRGPGPEFAPGASFPRDVRTMLASAATQFPSQVGIIDRPPRLAVREERRYGGPDAYDLAIGLGHNGRIVVPIVVVQFEVGNELSGHPGEVMNVTMSDAQAFARAIP